MDFNGKPYGIFYSLIIENYRCLLFKVNFPGQVALENGIKTHRQEKFDAALLNLLRETTSSNKTTVECSICNNRIGPFQALFISPCSHIYHHKCVSSIICISPMFLCPLCHRVTNLTASVSQENIYISSSDIPDSKPLIAQLNTPFNVSSDDKSKKQIQLPENKFRRVSSLIGSLGATKNERLV